MQKIILVFLFLVGYLFGSEQGLELFKSRGCASCHQPSVEAFGPSLKKIAKAYKGKREDLIRYLRGEAPPIVDPSRAGIMEAQLTMVKDLEEEQLLALVDFILSFEKTSEEQ